jgi:hypothetical protein
MRSFVRLAFMAFGVPLCILVTSCEKRSIDNSAGSAEFSIGSMDDLSSGKSGLTDSSTVISFQVLISVEDIEGKAVLTDKLVPLYSFGTGFVSEKTEIKAGDYKLTKFMVINPSGAVVYAAPLAGSPLAYLSSKPLPLDFSILTDQVTTVLPEVLPVKDQTPDKFGYASFGVQIIKPLEFWALCVLDPGNPMIMAPIQITNARVTVYAPDGWHYTFKLEPVVNHLIIRGGYSTYTFILEKDGYLTQRLQFTASQLSSATQENPIVFKIPWSSQYNVIVLQPGPEKGKDAMISNLQPDKNFGDYKYFEATYLSESVLTVMRSNRSLIWFNLDTLPKSAVIKKVVLHLSYDLPVPFDSTYYTTNTSPVAGIVWYGAVLQQIVEPWEENKVTWNSQPKTTEINQVYLAPFIRNTNQIEVDVTKLFVQPETASGFVATPNYGMLFKTWPVDRFPGFRFASSDYSVANMRPRLIVYYSIL